MIFDTVTELRLTRQEKELTETIKKGETPFLGLYSNFLYENLEKGIRDGLEKTSDPVWVFSQCLFRWPSVATTYLIQHIAEGYGQRGTHEVYPFLENALKTSLTFREKEKLWEAFRRACLKLGLSVSSRQSGTNYMVDEYLRQAGVPFKYLKPLASKMMAHADAVGLPDDDDPGGIQVWQLGLAERLGPPISKTVQRAMEVDDTGFYTRLFLRILDEPVSSGSDAPEFERILSEAIHEGGYRAGRNRTKRKALSIPQLVWRDNQIGIELPPGEEARWQVLIDGEESQYLGLMEGRFLPVDKELPREIKVRDLDGGVNRSYLLWEDGRDNRLLVFSASGLFAASGKLGNLAPISLEPGDYLIISRFVPNGLEDQTAPVKDDPSLYAIKLYLEPGGQAVFSRGPAELQFKADSKPLMLWEGESVKGIRGNEAYCSAGLKLRIVVPQEYLVEKVSDFFVRLYFGSDQVDLPLSSISETNQFLVDLEKLFQRWEPGVQRLLAELRRSDIRRPFVRSAVNLWNGLEKVENRINFFCSRLPQNLNDQESDNISIDRDQDIISFRNHENRLFRMVFNLNEEKKFLLTWSVPGVFLQIKDFNNQEVSEKPLKKGSVLSVSWSSRKVLNIFSTKSGFLVLGDFRKKIDFERVGQTRLPLTSLLEYVGPQRDILQFFDEKSLVVEDLVRLVVPHQIVNFEAQKGRESYRIFFKLADEVEEINLTALEVLSGRAEQIKLTCNDLSLNQTGGIQGFLTCQPRDASGLFNHELQIFKEGWPDGGWLLTLEAKIGGRWGRFANARGDHFCGGFMILDEHFHNYPQAFLDRLKYADPFARIDMLSRVNQALLRCYSHASWSEISWLEILWKELSRKSPLACEEKTIPKLVELAESVPPDTDSSSWVPMLSLSAKCPWIYAQSSEHYCELAASGSGFLQKCLRVTCDFQKGLYSLFQRGFFHPFFAFGFKNAALVIAGDEPKEFSLTTFESVLEQQGDLSERLRLLEQDDWEPGEGDYFGALHFLYAMKKLARCYQDTLAGNDFRRGRALLIARNLRSFAFDGMPQHLNTGKSFLEFGKNAQLEGSHQDHIQEINRFVSLFAKACRWDVRSPGVLDKFLAKLRDIVGEGESFAAPLGFLLYMGRDLFAFYLLLWEAVFTADFDRRS